jgi:hypothetical protein
MGSGDSQDSAESPTNRCHPDEGNGCQRALRLLSVLRAPVRSNALTRAISPQDVWYMTDEKLNDYGEQPIHRRHQNVSSYTLVYPRSLLSLSEPPQSLYMRISIISPCSASLVFKSLRDHELPQSLYVGYQ